MLYKDFTAFYKVTQMLYTDTLCMISQNSFVPNTYHTHTYDTQKSLTLNVFMCRVALIIDVIYSTRNESKTMINIWYSRYYMCKIREGEGQSISISSYDYIKYIWRGGRDGK